LGGNDTFVITDSLKRTKIADLSLQCNDFYVVDVLRMVAASKGTTLKRLHITDTNYDGSNPNIDKVDIQALKKQKPDGLDLRL
jgi:hypothetical protein